MKNKKLMGIVLAVALLLLSSLLGLPGEIPYAAAPSYPAQDTVQTEFMQEELLAPEGVFSQKDDVALYIHTYGCLPPNYITKAEARELGWESGGLDDYAYGKCIGGDRFGNYEGLLPDAPGRTWTECDIGTLHKDSRGAQRIVFSNDGLIYYTDDHYESFTLLYGEE